MATKQMKALKDFKYGTRMLRAGDPVDMKGPDVRLFTAIGAVGPLASGGQVIAPKPVIGEQPGETLVSKRAPRKRKAKNSK